MVSVRCGLVAIACGMACGGGPPEDSDRDTESNEDVGSTTTSTTTGVATSDADVTTGDGTGTGTETDVTTLETGESTFEPTGGESESTGVDTEDGTVTGDTTGRVTEPYGACPCVDGQETCIPFSDAGEAVADSCFLIGCENDRDCPEAEGGTAMPVCTTTLFPDGACSLDCDEDKVCPDGMACYEVALGGGISMFRCAWPY